MSSCQGDTVLAVRFLRGGVLNILNQQQGEVFQLYKSVGVHVVKGLQKDTYVPVPASQ